MLCYNTPSFVVNYTQLIVNNEYLDPENKGQSNLSKFIGKPIRFIARSVAIFAIWTIFAPLGTLYNGTQALIDYPEKRFKSARKYSRAALNDFIYGYMAISSLALYYVHSIPHLLFIANILSLGSALSNHFSRIELSSIALPFEDCRLSYVSK